MEREFKRESELKWTGYIAWGKHFPYLLSNFGFSKISNEMKIVHSFSFSKRVSEIDFVLFCFRLQRIPVLLILLSKTLSKRATANGTFEVWSKCFVLIFTKVFIYLFIIIRFYFFYFIYLWSNYDFFPFFN